MESVSKIKASAPGSLMLFGEHAVLHGKLSLVTAISRRIKVTLEGIPKRSIGIKSSFGESLLHGSSDYSFHGFHRFVMAALAEIFPHFPEKGFDLTIDSEFSDKLGLGSSSAVTVATVAAVLNWMGKTNNEALIFEHSFRAMRHIQGKGSGADIAASIYGGIIAYRSEPQKIQRLKKQCPLAVIYSGSKTPTVEVIEKVEQKRQLYPEKYSALFESIHKTTEQAIKMIEKENWEVLGLLANKHQQFMEAMGVSNTKLSEIIHFLQKEKDIFGAKISGAGLGDCVIGVGRMSLQQKCPYRIVPIEIAPQGVIVDRNI